MSNYEKQNFVSGQILKAEHLNHMEDGISQLYETTSQLSDENAKVKTHIEELDTAGFVIILGKNIVNPETLEAGVILNDGSISTDADLNYDTYATSDFINVDAYADYTLTIVKANDFALSTARRYVLLFDENKNVIADSYQNVKDQEVVTFNAGNARYVRVSGYFGTTGLVNANWCLQLEKGASYTGYEPYTTGTKTIREPYPDILRGKNWAVCGDSFTAGGYTTDDGFDESVYKFQNGKYSGANIVYPYIIAKRNNMNVVSFFSGGRTLANPADGTFTNSITNSNCDAYYQNIPENTDYITIYLGINDSHHEPGTSGTDGEDVTGVIPLGTIDDTDTSTFCGAWNVVLPWLMTNRPNAHIGIIVSNGVDRVEYRTATIAAAKKWGIPYLDLNGDERCPAMIRTVNPDISSEAKEILKQKWCVTETNQHPNVAAHRFESTFIENWLRTL